MSNSDIPFGLLRKGFKLKLIHEGIEKHTTPWQPGRKGSLCPKEITAAQAQELLNQSVPHGKKRYSVDSLGRPFCGQAHLPNRGRWHGYPVGWKEVPVQVQKAFKQNGLVSNRQLARFWEGI